MPISLPSALAFLAHFLVFLLPPLLPGVIQKTKAWLAGRHGPPVLQLYYDLFKLFHKDAIYSRTTTWVFPAGTAAFFVSAVLATFLLPIGRFNAAVPFSGDMVLFAYLLGLGRFGLALAAMDTGSSFEGMGTARELTFSALLEPTLFLSLAALVKLSGSFSLTPILATSSHAWSSQTAPLILVLVALGIFFLAENARIPVDDPNTHLELTMIHEVMILDHSGPGLGLILYGASLKLLLLGGLIVSLVLPSFSSPLANALAFVGALLLLCILVGLIESSTARLRMTRIPQMLVVAVLAAGFAFLLQLLG